MCNEIEILGAMLLYTLWSINRHTCILPITWPHIVQFKLFFHCCILR